MLSAVQSAPDDAVGLSPATSQSVLDLRRRNVYITHGNSPRKVDHSTLKTSGERGNGPRSNPNPIAWSTGLPRSTAKFSSRICREASDYDNSNVSPATSSTEHFGSGKSFEYFYSDGVQPSRPASRRAFSSCRSMRINDMDDANKRPSEPRTPQLGRRNSMRPQMFLGQLKDIDCDENATSYYSIKRQTAPPMSEIGRIEPFFRAQDIQLIPTEIESANKYPSSTEARNSSTAEDSSIERNNNVNNHHGGDNVESTMYQKCSVDLSSDVFSTEFEDEACQQRLSTAIGHNLKSRHNKMPFKRSRYYTMSKQLSETIAASKIKAAWRRYKMAVARRFEELVYSIELARQVAALTLERCWRGYKARKFVYDEVCRTRIIYWDPSMVDQEEAVLGCYTITVRGGFTAPAWKISIPMKYCPQRKIFIAYLKVSAGTYPCKFTVNGEQKICPWLYPTALDRDGFENSAVTVAEHPQKSWWMARFPRMEQLEPRNCVDNTKKQKGKKTK